MQVAGLSIWGFYPCRIEQSKDDGAGFSRCFHMYLLVSQICDHESLGRFCASTTVMLSYLTNHVLIFRTTVSEHIGRMASVDVTLATLVPFSCWVCNEVVNWLATEYLARVFVKDGFSSVSYKKWVLIGFTCVLSTFWVVRSIIHSWLS